MTLISLRDFRIGWRTLVREPAYSLVVVLGLGLGLAACLLLLGFVRYAWQYNAHVPDVEHVYVVKQRFNVDPSSPWFELAPLFLREAALKAPGVASATGFIPARPQDAGLVVRIGGQLHSLQALVVLPGLAETLGVQALQGDLQAALERPESFAITERAARRLFGSADIVGRTVQVEGKPMVVAAVLRDAPPNTTIPFEALVGVKSVQIDDKMRHELVTGEEGWWGKQLVRVRPGASLAAITELLQQAVDHAPSLQNQSAETKARLGQRKVMDIALSPLGSAYFDQGVASNFIGSPGERGNASTVAGLAAMALLIVALAAVNYVNLASVRVLQRQRELAMRKVLGASPARIIVQFLAESLLVSLVATGLGLLLAWLALPLFSELMNRRLESMLSPDNLAAAAVLGVLLGVLTAAYPAWLALRVQPNQVLAGRAGTESSGGMRLRRVLTVLQVAAAMGLAGYTLAIGWQTAFALRASPGFDPAPLLVVDLPDSVSRLPQARSLMAALAAQPGVAGVAVSEDAVGRHKSAWSRELRRLDGRAAPMDMKSVSANFFEQYGIVPQAGRLFDPRLDKEEDPVPLVINAIAARALGFASPAEAVGQTVLFTGAENKVVHKRVVGIAPDLRFYSLHEAPRATAYELWMAGTTLTVRANGPVAEVERLVQAQWPRFFPDAMLSMRRAGEILALDYAEDARIAKLLAVATAIALAIAAFGTYVLSAHTVQRRAREIVMRKLYGARGVDVAWLVVREIGTLAALAALLAMPLAAAGIERYLAAFVERAPMAYGALVLALAATLAIALLAVARQARLAMRLMAADALRV